MISMPNDDFLTEEETASILNKTIASLRADASRRKGPPRIRVGKRVLYRKSQLEKWLTEHECDFASFRSPHGH